MMNRFLALFFLLLFCSCTPSKTIDLSDHQQLTWRKLSHAKEEALATNKPMLIDFFTSKECHRCQFLVGDIYSNQAIVERINRDFVPVRVNLDTPMSEEEKTLAARLESGEECILAFLTASGSVVTDKEGKRICSMDRLTPESFTFYLDKALENLSTP